MANANFFPVFVILFSVKVQATNLVSTTSRSPLVLILVTHLPKLDNARLRFISNFMIALQIRYLYFVKTYIYNERKFGRCGLRCYKDCAINLEDKSDQDYRIAKKCLNLCVNTFKKENAEIFFSRKGKEVELGIYVYRIGLCFMECYE